MKCTHQFKNANLRATYVADSTLKIHFVWQYISPLVCRRMMKQHHIPKVNDVDLHVNVRNHIFNLQAIQLVSIKNLHSCLRLKNQPRYNSQDAKHS